MKRAVDKRGFTLLEVLIATVVLAISLSGLYMLLRSGIKTTDAVLTDVELLEASNDLLYRAYREKLGLTETGSYRKADEYEGIKYRIDRTPTGIEDVYEYRLSVKKDGRTVVYRYYK